MIKYGNVTLTTVLANRHGVINNTTQSEITRNCAQNQTTQGKRFYREYLRIKLEKSTQRILRLDVFMVLKLTSAGKLFHALITLTQKKLLRIPVLLSSYLYPLKTANFTAQ